MAIRMKYMLYTGIYKMDIDPSARISFGARLDKTNPQGVHIGKESLWHRGRLSSPMILVEGFTRIRI